VAGSVVALARRARPNPGGPHGALDFALRTPLFPGLHSLADDAADGTDERHHIAARVKCR
jgi:hypothetical protein